MKAHQLIDSPEKWTQEEYSTCNGRHCAVGAYTAAYGIRPGSGRDAYCRASEELQTRLGAIVNGYDNPEDWNDKNSWETVYNTLKELDI